MAPVLHAVQTKLLFRAEKLLSLFVSICPSLRHCSQPRGLRCDLLTVEGEADLETGSCADGVGKSNCALHKWCSSTRETNWVQDAGDSSFWQVWQGEHLLVVKCLCCSSPRRKETQRDLAGRQVKHFFAGHSDSVLSTHSFCHRQNAELHLSLWGFFLLYGSY